MISKNDRYADAYGRATGFIKRKEGISVSTLWSILKGISEALVDFGEDQTLVEDWAKSKLMEELGIGEEEIQEELNKEKESPVATAPKEAARGPCGKMAARQASHHYARGLPRTPADPPPSSQ